MRTKGFWGVILISASLGLGCEQPKKQDIATLEAETVVATVNGEVITLAELNRRVVPVRAEYRRGQPPKVRKGLADIQQEFLEKLIEERLLLQEAKRRSLQVSPEEVAARLSELWGEQKDKAGMPQERKVLEEQVRKELLINKLIQQEVAAKVEVSLEEAWEYYNTHKEEFHQPEQVRVQQIVVETEKEARDLLKKLKRGADFGRLAEEHSLGPEGHLGGDLGYFSRGQMPEEFDAVAFKLKKKGQISEVFKSKYGFHIFKLVDKKPERYLEFEEVRDKIMERLRQKKAEEAFQEWLRELKARAKIKVNPYFKRSDRTS